MFLIVVVVAYTNESKSKRLHGKYVIEMINNISE